MTKDLTLIQFDYCDPQNTFATSVVQRAVASPTLLYAILATSARHLSMTSGYDAYLADHYHRECLALLIDIVGDTSALLDDALCAATVILRLFEEISGTYEGCRRRACSQWPQFLLLEKTHKVT